MFPWPIPRRPPSGVCTFLAGLFWATFGLTHGTVLGVWLRVQSFPFSFDHEDNDSFLVLSEFLPFFAASLKTALKTPTRILGG